MYYSVLKDEILLKLINNHPVFSYALTAIKNFTDNYIVFVTNSSFIEIVSEYHDNVKFLDDSISLPSQGTEIGLDRPLLNKNHLEGKIDRLYNFVIKDEIDFYSIIGLIKTDFCTSRPKKNNNKYHVEFKKNHGKPKLLITAPYSFFSLELINEINEQYDVIYAYQAPYSKVKELIYDRDVLFTSTCPNYLIDNNLTDNSSLKIIATPSTGVNHISLKNKNIKIISIKNSKVIEEIYASSEFSFTLLLALYKKLNIVLENTLSGNWRQFESSLRSNELNNKKIGLIGFGRIGKKMAVFSKAFGMEVHVYDPFVEIPDNVISHEDKNSLLQICDIVSLHYHLNDANHKSFNKNDFEQMKNDAVFINTSRGELIDEIALINALKNQKIRGAAVDVISEEHVENKWNHPLIRYARENANLLISSHVAGLTVESETKAASDIFKQLKHEIS